MSFSSELFHHSFCCYCFSSFGVFHFFHYMCFTFFISSHMSSNFMLLLFFFLSFCSVFSLGIETLFELFEISLPFSDISSRINNNSPNWMKEKDKRHHIFFYCFKAEPDVENYLIKRHNELFANHTQTTITAD